MADGTAVLEIVLDDKAIRAAEREAVAAQKRAAAEADRYFKKQQAGVDRVARRFAKAKREEERAAKQSAAAQVREQKRVERAAENASAQRAQDFRTLAAGAALAAAALAGVTKAVIDQQNALSDLATRTGLGRDTLAGLQVAAEGSGQKLESLTGSLQQFPKRLAEFAAGTGEAKEGLEALGFTADDLPLEDMDGSLRKVLESISALKTPAERSAAATQIFGRAGTALAQAGLLQADALDQAVVSARASGVANAEAAETAAAAQVEFALLGQAARGAGADMLAGSGIVDALRQASDFIDYIRLEGLPKLSTNLARAVKGWETLGQVLTGDKTLKQASSDLKTFEQALQKQEREAEKAAEENQKAKDAIRETGTAASDAGPDLDGWTGRMQKASAAAKQVTFDVGGLRDSLYAEARAVLEAQDPLLAYERKLADIAVAGLDVETSTLLQAEAFKALQAAQQEQGAAAREATADLLKEMETQRQAAEDLRSDIVDLEVSTMSERAQLRHAFAQQLADYNDEIDGLVRSGAISQEEANALSQRAMTALNKLESRERIKIAAQEISQIGDILGSIASIADTQRTKAEERIADIQEALNAQADALTEGQKAALEARLEAEQTAALKAWKAQQSAAAAQAALNTLAAVSIALASAPPPYNAIPAGVALASGVAQEVAIAQSSPPEFDDTPGVQRAAGDTSGRTVVSLKNGDLFAAAQRPQDLAAQVEGMLNGLTRRREFERGGVVQTNVALRVRGRTAETLSTAGMIARRGPAVTSRRVNRRVGG